MGLPGNDISIPFMSSSRRPIVPHQRGKPPPDTETQAGACVEGVNVVQVVSFLIGHHGESQFVVIKKEDFPLAAFRNIGDLLEDVDNRLAIFQLNRHEHAWHQRKMKSHVELATVPQNAGARLQDSH
jgi:hypothetical protein